jgi:enoyl-CoA hydratase/carnithine racemase
MDARRAFEIGLVQRLAADRDELMQSVDDVASQILLCAPLAVEAIKRVVKCGRDLPPEYSRKLAEPLVEMIARTRDREEGPRAFAERRMPVWRME